MIDISDKEKKEEKSKKPRYFIETQLREDELETSHTRKIKVGAPAITEVKDLFIFAKEEGEKNGD